MKIEFFRHNINNHDIRRTVAVLKSVFLTTGHEVESFEREFASYLKAEDAVGVTSCTAALHLSLLAVGIKEGDEVITTPMSFCATANAILHAGARPVFVDVEDETGNINAELIEAAVTKKTKALLPVHLYGQMCDMRTIKKTADRYGLAVIEDAAHSIEAMRNGIRPGGLSDAACFSFYATKNITSGEGGAVTTSRKRADVVRMLRLHGIDKSAVDRYTGKYRHWDMPLLGWKYNMDNIQAALLRGQLERIERLWKKRNRLWEIYEAGLADIRELRVLRTVENSRHARHLFTVLVPPRRRNSILHALQAKGVGVAVNYRPIHLLEYYRKTFGYRTGDFPVAEDIGRRTVTLPLYPGMKEGEATYVMATLKSIMKS